ncbi:tRNA (adenosine(37)-N6)-threonylcarbamoyltransferase complex dimerization subunit type 1 TsaB [Candidatus Poribacteria bacterium]|jgi:tRNA threonylcarbamoyladenosine biosynthesis protein TsaB|nr:tRNA (adenosine(37)-N6)-threonylcarbamoyltransferase complex dimerization subunit type 1 TsaB [Candidatus Poribacteria bacterium]MBT5536381.1 tRNA (adenosine(37)-N6)-threonylcarbamoyltransferase complex dimerization subunit type 1 TsaB [Candidatus Poribacteria bacterium]MBT7098409.1 tRNA (adenosine(37)-N6)-threonylcarbamoyltransferase complex dimerization subunit type 1 TsaB [Candidatus Poribacteria bacterium]MBT7805455.1 tRNA (adenosine(37)-N6)-threonylcarbamoyltransferase complex dimerizati
MRIVALDTSARMGGVALQDGDDLVVDAAVAMERQHSERLLPTLAWAMETFGWSGDSVDLVAATHGPGPFTAVRAGVTVAKTLAYGWGVDVAGFSTMDAIAHGYRHIGRPLHILFDARKQQVFSARYAPAPGCAQLVRLGDVVCCSADEALNDAHPKTLYVGNGADAYRDAIEANGPEGANIADTAAGLCRPGAVAALAAHHVAAAPPTLSDVHGLAPMYIRRPEAEVRADAAARG